jgi:hypothetical protein
MVAAITSSPRRMLVGATLKALAERKFAQAGRSFTTAELRGWVPCLQDAARNCRYVTGELLKNEFVAVAPKRQGVYVVTDVGVAAIKAAAAGKPPPQAGGDRPIKPKTAFSDRLWSLMRARQILDAGAAAETLVDAGDDQVLKAAQRRAAMYLREWETAGYLEQGRQRIGRHKRFVLVNDPGPATPTVH